MPLQHYAEWVDAPGTKTKYFESPAGIQHFVIDKEFSPKHTLNFGIFKTTLYKGNWISSKLLPLIITIRETKDLDYFIDNYSFDKNGICLSHGYSRIKNKKRIVDEQHDTDISRLLEHSKTIEEIIKDYPLPPPILTHRVVMNLRDGCLKQR